MSLMLQAKEVAMARSLHVQKAWEELAEDPFRGLRAGPVTFSPFLFFLPARDPERLRVASQILEKTAVQSTRVRLCLTKKSRKGKIAALQLSSRSESGEKKGD